MLGMALIINCLLCRSIHYLRVKNRGGKGLQNCHGSTRGRRMLGKTSWSRRILRFLPFVSGEPSNPQPGGRTRRAFFSSALGLGGVIGVAQAASAAPGGRKSPGHSVHWVHGNSATAITHRDLERDTIEDNARVIHGRSWSVVPLHFSIPSPKSGGHHTTRVRAIWVRMKADRGASIQSVTLHDGERGLAHMAGLGIHRGQWEDVQIPLDQPAAVTHGLGVTVHCAFADVGRRIGISAIGGEFEIVA